MTTVPTPLWRRTLRAIDPLSRAAVQAPTLTARDRDRPPPGSTATRASARPRAVTGRRALQLAASALAAFVIAFASVTIAIAAATAVIYGIVWLVGWQAVTGFIIGAAAVVGVSEFTGWNRHRKLRELLDWLGEDNQARKMAALRNDQRIRYMKGELP